jgi:hypothetical protein
LTITNKMSHSVAIEPDEIDDLPAYAASSSAPLQSISPQPQVQGRLNTIAGEVASDRRYTGGDTLDEPVSTTIVVSSCIQTDGIVTRCTGCGVEGQGCIVAYEIISGE